MLLSWKVVEKRIRKLITQDKYLSPEEKEEYARYQEKQAQKRLEAEKERLAAEETKAEIEDIKQNEPEPQEKEPELPESEPEPQTERIDKTNAVNFHITNDSLGADAVKANAGFSPKEKFRRNTRAIHTLEKIEGENRTATPEE